MKTQVAVIASTRAGFDAYVAGSAQDSAQFCHVAALADMQGALYCKVVRTGPYWHIYEHKHLYAECLRRVVR